MIYKLKHGDDIKYFGQIGADHGWDVEELMLELDKSFDCVDALYSFTNIPMLMLAYNNSKDDDDWYMKIEENDDFEYSFIKNIPEEHWYTWDQLAFLLNTAGYIPYSNDETSWFDAMSKQQQQTFNVLGIRGI